MNTSQQRVARAIAWWETLPTDLRPTRQDVEVVARLGVTQVPVMVRMLWEDQPALGRYFAELAAILAGADPLVIQSQESAGAESAPPTLPDSPATPSEADPAPAQAHPTPDDLGSWIDTMRDRGVVVPIDEKLASRLLEIRTGEELARLTVDTPDRRRWRDFLQEPRS